MVPHDPDASNEPADPHEGGRARPSCGCDLAYDGGGLLRLGPFSRGCRTVQGLRSRLRCSDRPAPERRTPTGVIVRGPHRCGGPRPRVRSPTSTCRARSTGAPGPGELVRRRQRPCLARRHLAASSRHGPSGRGLRRSLVSRAVPCGIPVPRGAPPPPDPRPAATGATTRGPPWERPLDVWAAMNDEASDPAARPARLRRRSADVATGGDHDPVPAADALGLGLRTGYDGLLVAIGGRRRVLPLDGALARRGALLAVGVRPQVRSAATPASLLHTAVNGPAIGHGRAGPRRSPWIARSAIPTRTTTYGARRRAVTVGSAALTSSDP